MIKKLKETKGITLIALVITIIVLLILAGVSILALMGDNGILTQAKNTKDEYQIAQEKEQIALAVTQAKVQSLGEEILAQDVYDSLKENLNEEDDLIVIKMTSFLFEIGMPSGRNYYYNNGEVILYTPSIFSSETLSSSEPLPIIADFNFNLRTEYDKNTSRIYYNIDATKQQIEDFATIQHYASILAVIIGMNDSTEIGYMLGMDDPSITVGDIKNYYFHGRTTVTETQLVTLVAYTFAFPNQTYNPFLPTGDYIRENKENLYNFMKNVSIAALGENTHAGITAEGFGVSQYLFGLDPSKLFCRVDGNGVQLHRYVDSDAGFVYTATPGTYVFEIDNSMPSVIKATIISSPIEVLAP